VEQQPPYFPQQLPLQHSDVDSAVLQQLSVMSGQQIPSHERGQSLRCLLLKTIFSKGDTFTWRVGND
jgi:hypothetical protein